MSGISAVIITLNEERNIQRCIRSVKPVADEIIVMDSFSTDGTKEICLKEGVEFHQQDWKGYAQTKNEANRLAKHEYILSVDADEALSETLLQSILKEKEKGLTGIYECNRLTNYCGQWIRHCGWYPDRKIRLFPKEGTAWVGDYVHETLEFSGSPTKQSLAGNLLHYSFYSLDEHLQRIEKYAPLEAKKLMEKGKTSPFPGIFFSPFFKFIKMFFFKLGFLDGGAGWQVCRMSAFASYMKYKKLGEGSWEMEDGSPESKNGVSSEG